MNSMRDRHIDSREFIHSLFALHKARLEEALKFYNKLEDSVPLDDHWKVLQESPLHDDLRGLMPHQQDFPSRISSTAIQTMNEYLEAIDAFTDDQFAAFMMGICVNWIPVQYWGIEEVEKHCSEIQKARAYYDKLEAEIPKDELWKITWRNPLVALPGLEAAGEKMPSEILEMARQLNECLIQTLADRPF